MGESRCAVSSSRTSERRLRSRARAEHEALALAAGKLFGLLADEDVEAVGEPLDPARGAARLRSASKSSSSLRRRRRRSYVLDEPTAHLDSPTAKRLVEDVFASAGDRCVLLITHRPEGVDLADEFVMLRG